MSSLFSILSLFTEDVKLRHDDQLPNGARFPNGAAHSPDSVVASPAMEPSTPGFSTRGSQDDVRTKTKLPSVPPLTLGSAFDERQYKRRPLKRMLSVSAHPDIVARAVVDTTIAIIPASAFRRLTRVYPKATAHIVQVILTRLHRVTLSTAHQYLGLTSEVLQIEKLMNKYTAYDLPNHLRGQALDRLRDKFTKERERIGPEEGTKGIALHNPTAGRRRSSSGLRKEAATTARMNATRATGPNLAPDARRPPMSDRNVSSGDLHGASRPSQRPNSLHVRSTSNWTTMGAPDSFRMDLSPIAYP